MATFRDSTWNLSPSRLRTSKAARIMYSFIGLPLDLLAQAAKEALLARFPELAPDDALPYMSRDRGVRRGPNEPSQSFVLRLRQWRAIWRGAGVGRAMLDDIAIFLYPQTCRLRIWTQAGIIYTREPNGTLLIDRAAPGYWNWDNLPALYARFWVVIYSFGGVPWSRDGTWGDGDIWQDDPLSTWGSTATIDQVRGIRQIIEDRKPGPAVCKNIIVSFDEFAFEPGDTIPPLPDGTWAHWSKNDAGVQVPTRDDRGIYWDGVA